MNDDLIRMEIVAILNEKGISEGGFDAMAIAEELTPIAEAWAKRATDYAFALARESARIERVRAIVDRVAADPANATDEVWVYSIRKALACTDTEPEDAYEIQSDGWPRRECDHDSGECHDVEHQR